jgi:recombination protein RecR
MSDASLLLEPVARLIDELGRLPGIGPKSASRLAFFILRAPEAKVSLLAQALLAVKQQVRQCVRCHYISDQEYCAVCRNPVRQTGTICVVEDPLDALAIERTGSFKGSYHVLHGRIAPLEGMGREDIFFDDLLERIGTESIREVIIATNPNLEGEATAAYLQRELSPLGTRVTRRARGLPTGGDLEWADTHTLTSALEGRRELL